MPPGARSSAHAGAEDCHGPGQPIIHPGGPIISALLALAEYHPVDGTAFLDDLCWNVEKLPAAADIARAGALTTVVRAQRGEP